MAGTGIRLSCESGKCDDDSPPVCLVQLNPTRAFSEIVREDPISPKGPSGIGSRTGVFPCYSDYENSPELPRMGNSTPDKTITDEQTYPESAVVSGLSVIEASDSVNSSGDPSASEQRLPTSAETPDLAEAEVPLSKSSDPSIGLTLVAGQNRATTVHEDASASVTLEHQKACLSQADHPVSPVQLVHVAHPNLSEREGPIEPEVIEEDDVDLEDRPLTVVDIPQETEAVTGPAPTVPTSVECKSEQLPEEKDLHRDHIRVSPDVNVSASSLGVGVHVSTHSNESKSMEAASPNVQIIQSKSTASDTPIVVSSLNKSASSSLSESALEPKTEEHSVQLKINEDQPCATATVLDHTTSRPNTPSLPSSTVIALDPTMEVSHKLPLATVSTNSSGPMKRATSSAHSEADRLLPGKTTAASSVAGVGVISIASAISLPGIGTSLSTPASLSSSAPTFTSPVTLTSHSTVQLMPFVATSIPGATTGMLNNLAAGPTVPGASAISLGGPQPTGLATNGPSSLQIFNMTPMPQFVGAPGIVLHATGPVPGTPAFPGSNPLLPSLPTVGNAPGLGGTTTLNFLQPHQPFSTSLLPQSNHGTDYLLDLGLSQTPFPPNTNSITLFNPLESIGAGPLSHTATIYPTVLQPPPGPGPPQPHSQSLFPTSCALNASISGPLFVSPPSTYRPSMGGVTNLVSCTTPQMATSLGSGPGPFGPANLSSLGGSAAAPGGFLFQTTNSHPQPSSTQLIPPCGPIIQSSQFPSYPIPFQGADSCLPLAPALTTTLPGFRPTETQIETSVSSAHMTTTPGLPQLWASSTPVSSFSPIPICPSSLPQPATFPITANPSSTVLAPVVAAVSTSSSSPTTTTTSTILPHPPALQPCPALTKRFQRLCPLPTGRSSNSSGTVLSPSPTKRNPSVPLRPSGLSATLATSTGYTAEKRTISSSGYSTAIRSRPPVGPLTVTKPTTVSASIAGLTSGGSNSLGATMTIRTPNSVTVIPAIRRRRPLARATPSLKAAGKMVNHQSIEVSCNIPATNIENKVTVSATPISTIARATNATATGAPSPTTMTTPPSALISVSSSPLVPIVPTTTEAVSCTASQRMDTESDKLDLQIPSSGDSAFPGVQPQTSPTTSPSKPMCSHSDVSAAVGSSETIADRLSGSARSFREDDLESPTHVPVSLSGPKPAIEPQDILMIEKPESPDHSSKVNTNQDPDSEADTPRPKNVVPTELSPRNPATPNSSVGNSSPSSCNHSHRSSGSKSIVKPTSPVVVSAVSPVPQSTLSNGVMHTDSTELQASLERLGVSGSQSRKVSEPSATVSVTTTPTTHSHQWSLRPTDHIGVVHSSPMKTIHPALSVLRMPPPLLHHGPDDRRILTHFIDGHVIYESNKPFPVKHGMSVVEAALLHQCITEEQEENEGQNVMSTTSSLHRPRRSSSSSSGFAVDAPVVAPVNGEQPMHVDYDSPQTDRRVDVKLPSDSCAVQSTPKRTSCTSNPEHESSYPKSSDTPTPNNEYLVLQNSHSKGVSKANVPGLKRQTESSNYSGGQSDQDTTTPRVKTPISGRLDPSATVINVATTTAAITIAPFASTQCLSQRPQQSVYARMSPAVCAPSRPLEAYPDVHSTLSTRSPARSVSQTSSPAQTPHAAQHGTPSVGPASHQFHGFFTYPHPHPVPQLPEPPPPGPVRFWSADDVVAFVRGTPGCGAYAEAFHINEIDGEALLLLAEDQFIQPPIGMKIGPALKLAARLETLRNVS